MSVNQPVSGSCLCRGVHFELTPPFELASFCHCEHCRRHSGNFGSASIEVALEQMRVVAGEELLGHWQPRPMLATKIFCRRCGSSLFGTGQPGSPTIWVRMGVLDVDPGLRPSRHVWVGSAPSWFPVPDDGLPRYVRRPPG